MASIQAEPQKEGFLGLLKGAKFKPHAQIRFRVYDRNGKDLLWNAPLVKGDTVTGEGTIAGGKDNLQRVNLLIAEAVKSAWKKLTDSYRSAFFAPGSLGGETTTASSN